MTRVKVNVVCEAVEMRPRDLFMGLRGWIGGLPGGPRGSRGKGKMSHRININI